MYVHSRSTRIAKRSRQPPGIAGGGGLLWRVYGGLRLPARPKRPAIEVRRRRGGTALVVVLSGDCYCKPKHEPTRFFPEAVINHNGQDTGPSSLETGGGSVTSPGR